VEVDVFDVFKWRGLQLGPRYSAIKLI